MAEKCFHSICTSIISFYLNPWLITLGSKIANIQSSTGIPFNLIKNSSSLKIMAIINEVEGCMDLSPLAESAVYHRRVTSRKDEGKCPDYGQKCTIFEVTSERHSRQLRKMQRLVFVPAPKSMAQFSVKIKYLLWKWGFCGNPQIFPPEGKL